jgi:hypothetical protein
MYATFLDVGVNFHRVQFANSDKGADDVETTSYRRIALGR